MKKSFKKFSKLFLLFATCFSMLMVANAETAAKKLTITNYSQSNIPMSFPATFHVKKTSGGKYSYCTYYAKTPPTKAVSYTRGSLVSDNGMNYILKEAYDSKNDSSFFIYQTALWIYMIDKGMMQGPYYDLTVFRSNVNSSSSSTAAKIRKLVSDAKKAGANDTKAPSIKVNAKNVKFALGPAKKYYISSNIKVTSSTGSYTVKLTSAPEGTLVKKSGNTFVIKVPVSKVSNLKTNIKFTVSNSKNVYTSYYYKPSNSSYQIMAATYKDTKTDKASATLTLEKSTSVPVIKVDATTKAAVAGAGLQVLNSQGNVIDSWTSTTEAHTVTGLSAGTYTLKEISAPSGYVLSNVEVKFTVGSDGKVKTGNGTEVTRIEFTNEKTSTTISKQDITNQKELPGATLVIKDKNGNEVAKWTSSENKYVIRGLAAGTYTLIETIAPEGYALSTETITFTLDKYGKLYDGTGKAVDSITMYNSPVKEEEISISKRDITTNAELPGATLKLTDATGNVVDSWVSEKTDHVIKNLAAGTYTLTETVAPEGYVLSTEAITFKVDAEGKLYDKDGNSISKVIMYNKPETTSGGASISKQDATTGKELPGATLVLKDYDGNEIDTWISGDKPHIIEDIKPGIYTLTETIAPEGYVLSTEVVTFTVKDDGSVVEVIMYNSPDSKDIPTGGGEELEVENTGSFKTITSSIIGTIVMLVGGFVIYKSSKKRDLD